MVSGEPSGTAPRSVTGVQTGADPDWRVFEVVQTWPERADADSVHFSGVNLGHAVRRGVMQALAAIVRPIAYPELAERDAQFRETWGLDAATSGVEHRLRRALKHTVIPNTLGRLGHTATGVRARRIRASTSAPRLLVKSTSRLDALIHAESFDFPGDIIVAGTSGSEAGKHPFVPVRPEAPPARSQFTKFRHALQQGLRDSGYELDSATADAIVDEARFEAARIKAIQHTLDALEPNAILLHDDTTPEGLTWALAAKAHGIAAITVAHGLDCERFFLDPVYASAKCVWGPDRAERIRATARRLSGDQSHEPHVHVTGNPAYDGVAPARETGTGGLRWLWVTRPHTPRKCLTPGRFPVEGADILEALFGALRHMPSAQLTIKPHPADYSRIYSRMASNAGLNDRVTLRHDSLAHLFASTDVVIAEDSTAALDACLAGKPIVHAHFAPTPPVLPLGEMKAALPGREPEQLSKSLHTASRPARDFQTITAYEQATFIQATAPVANGSAIHAICDHTNEVLPAYHSTPSL